MERSYHKWRSAALDRDMELLVFGHAGARALVFPTRGGRFYDYENWGLVDAACARIEAGALQLFCVDSIDQDALYAENLAARTRIERHMAYERYILQEVLPFAEAQNPSPGWIAHGCSLGAYHAVNIALRHPQRFAKVVALSGRYDLTQPLGGFRDLFDGYYDEDVYYHNPSHFVANMWDPALLDALRCLEIILAIGQDDAFYENNVQFAETLRRLHIPHVLDIREGEAHRARCWRSMVTQYL